MDCGRTDGTLPLRDSKGRFQKGGVQEAGSVALETPMPGAGGVSVAEAALFVQPKVVLTRVDDVGSHVTSRRSSISSVSGKFWATGSESDSYMSVASGDPVKGKKRRRKSDCSSGSSREGSAPKKTTPNRAGAKRRGTSPGAAEGATDGEVELLAAAGLDALNAQELRARAGEDLACIIEVAKKSGNLKGEYVAKLKKSASTLTEVVEALASRSEAEETRRLRAENRRLKLEVEAIKAEVRALRRAFSEAKSEAAAATTAAAGARAAPAAVVGVELVEELRRSLTCSLGDMMNARFAGIEDRLLPAPRLRPPLRADAVAAAPSGPPPAPRGSEGTATSTAGPSTVAQAQTTTTVVRKGKGKGKGKSSTPVPAPAPPGPKEIDSPTAGPSTVVQEETWATVVRKGKGKGKEKSSTPAPAHAAQSETPKPKGKASKKPTAKPTGKKSEKPTAEPSAKPSENPAAKATAQPKMKAPKTAAVVLSLQPEAVERGITYSSILRTAQEKVNLQELGISRIHFRQTATGARMLEIPGSEKHEKADRLAESLRGVLSEVANVVRPVKSVEIRISELDETATKEGVAAAVAKATGVDVGLVKAGGIRPGYGGTGSVIVSCPISAAKALREKGRILIGWSSARVVALGARPMRCYRCMGLGHTRPQCPASVDRGDLCFRCGSAGHKAVACGEATLRCAICAESGRPSGHVMGGRKCKPATKKGKAAGVRATPAPASQVAEEPVVPLAADAEGVVMSE
ncbi:unnamed protein product [Euphydryas editha]|uniref:CCHC-type domain-containing protein n=1 Tax=Euphydryas editha TaxID=104508 RepID=A0AAU9UJC3_EUPED|nr:unnamed protein product [Euphydryas editha]